MTDKIQTQIDKGTALSPMLAIILMILLRAGGLFETGEAEAEPEFIVKNAPTENMWIDRRQALMGEFVRQPHYQVSAFECGDGPDRQGYMAFYGRSAGGREVYLGRFQDQPDALNIQTLLNLNQSDNVTFQPDGTLRVNGEVVELGPVEMNSLARYYGVPSPMWASVPNHLNEWDRPGMPGYCTPSREGVLTAYGGARREGRTAAQGQAPYQYESYQYESYQYEPELVR